MNRVAKARFRARHLRDIAIIVVAHYYMAKAIESYADSVQTEQDKMYIELKRRLNRIIKNYKVNYLKKAERHINKVASRVSKKPINTPYLPLILLMMWYELDDKTIDLKSKNLITELLDTMSKGFAERGENYKEIRRRTDDTAEFFLKEISKEIGIYTSTKEVQ